MSNSSVSSITLGSYQLCERIGEGGSSQVYRATQSNGKSVALKMLGANAELDGNSARFQSELKALKSIAHENIVGFVEHGFDDELGPYLVTEYIPGQSLRSLITGSICPEAVLLVLREIASALVCLHGQSLIHRDLKPENLMATPDGDVVVIDLGLALHVVATRHTEEGHIVGSIPYMAPEQLNGDPALGPAVDIWALGVMAYEWLSGQRPFYRERPSEEAAAVLIGRYPPMESVDRRPDDTFVRLVSSCLQANPEDRPSAEEVLAICEESIAWTDSELIRVERAAMISNPQSYQERVKTYRVRNCLRETEDALDADKPFIALRKIDQGLAYAPENAELLAAATRAERATAGSPQQPVESDNSTGQKQQRLESGPSQRFYLGIAVLLLAGVGGAYLLRDSSPAPAPEKQESTPELVRESAGGTEKPAPDPDSANIETLFKLGGGMLSIVERSVALEEKEAAEKAKWSLAPIPGLQEIPESRLNNNTSPKTDDESIQRPSNWADVQLVALRSSLQSQPELGSLDTELLSALKLLPKNRKAAVGIFKEAYLANTDEVRAILPLGLLALQKKEHEIARTVFSQLLKIDPNHVMALTGRGMAERQQWRAKDAYRDLSRAAILDRGSLRVLLELAALYRDFSYSKDAQLIDEYICASQSDFSESLQLKEHCKH